MKWKCGSARFSQTFVVFDGTRRGQLNALSVLSLYSKSLEGTIPPELYVEETILNSTSLLNAVLTLHSEREYDM
jgi:hypothetical protein